MGKIDIIYFFFYIRFYRNYFVDISKMVGYIFICICVVVFVLLMMVLKFFYWV